MQLDDICVAKCSHLGFCSFPGSFRDRMVEKASILYIIEATIGEDILPSDLTVSKISFDEFLSILGSGYALYNLPQRTYFKGRDRIAEFEGQSGDEFVILVDNKSSHISEKVARRIKRIKINVSRRFSFSEKSITVSTGAAISLHGKVEGYLKRLVKRCTGLRGGVLEE